MDAARRWARTEELFDAVIDLDESARAEYLHRECADPELRAEVTALIDSAESSREFLSPAARASAGPRLPPGTQVGGWRIGELLGRGGMGEVYEAERTGKDFEQRGALKLLTRLDSEDSRLHFARERRILGSLQHPAIAHLLDGGEYEGLPWAVMEYVEGVPLDRFARDRRLAERVELLLKVCAAVSHAHRHLVIHRDLKPGNILVTADGRVKLLDFGIAKLLETDVPGNVTQVIRASPDYCAPEQLERGAVSVATDVYALGVILYEMLTGVRPWGPHEQGWAQTLQRLSGDVAPAPSQRVEGSLRKRLRGDLDSIVLKALRAEPAERYADVDALAEDLSAWLESRPVKARDGTLGYLVGRSLKRHRWWYTAGAVALAAVIAFIGLMLHFNRQLQAEKALALTERDRAETTRNLLARIMTEADPFGGSGADTRLSDALAQSEEAIEIELAGDDQLQAELYGVIADVWQGLSEDLRSVEARQRQLAALSRIESPGSLRTLSARRKLLQSRVGIDDADSVKQALYALRERLASDHPRAILERAVLERDLGLLHADVGQIDPWYEHHQASVAMLEAADPPRPLELASSLLELGAALDGQQRYEDALEVTQRALQIRVQELGGQHPLTLHARTYVAARLSRANRPREGIEIYEQIIPVLEKRLGPLHDQLLSVMTNHVYSHVRAGDLDAAIPLLQELQNRQRQKPADSDSGLGESHQLLGVILARKERFGEALNHLQQAVRIFEAHRLPGNFTRAYPHLTMARIHGELGDVDKLEEHTQLAIRAIEGHVSEQHPMWYTTRCLLGDVALRRGQATEGERLVRQGLAGLSQLAESVTHAEECRKVLRRAGLSPTR